MTAEEIYKNQCIHCLGIEKDPIGEYRAYCEESYQWENITLGNCFGNCEGYEVETRPQMKKLKTDKPFWADHK